jgi:hypothetical protein
MVGSKSLKGRLFAFCDRLPLIGETADPVIAAMLVGIGLLTLIAVAIPSAIFPGDKDARSHVIQVAAGVVLILGAYFAPVSIRELRSQQYSDRLGRIFDQLASSNEVTRIGAIRLLHAVAIEQRALPADAGTKAATIARRRAIWDVLSVISKDQDSTLARLAAEIQADLLKDGLSPPEPRQMPPTAP